MDLEGGSSAIEESVDIGNPSGKLANAVETKIENNGTYAVDETMETGSGVLEDKVKSSSPLSSPRTSKGKGLKKWRRIKRDVSSEGGSNLDTSKLLKRGLSNQGANSNRPMQYSAETKQNSEGSVSSTNDVVRNLSVAVDQFAEINDSDLGMSPILAAGTESENSEDRSTKSSTAASAPKIRHEMAMVSGFMLDKNLSGKSLSNSIQKGHQGKVRTETSKKLRGEMVKIEKENSHSSMESDSRSSKFVFMQGNNSGTSNGRQSRKSVNYDGENSEEAQDGDWQLGEELQAGSNRKYGGDFEVTSQEKLAAKSTWGFKEEKSDNNGPSSSWNIDHMAESVITLQSLQEELEKEVQKFREIGKQDLSDNSVLDSGSDQPLQSDDLVQEPSDALEPDTTSLKQKMNLLERKLDDAAALLKVKEARIIELEGTLNSKLPEGETGRTIELHQESYRDMEIELECLFKQKIESEVEYLAISRTIQKLRVAVVDQITAMEEQKSQQAQMMSNLEDTEAKAAVLKGLSTELEKHSEDIARADETSKLKSKVCKYTSFFFLQLISLVLTLFLWQLYPHDTEVVPT